MDLTVLWGGIVSFIIFLLGLVIKNLNQKIDDMESRHTKALKDAISMYKDSVHSCDISHERMQDVVTNIQINYVHKEDMKEMRKELLDRFDRLETLVRSR